MDPVPPWSAPLGAGRQELLAPLAQQAVGDLVLAAELGDRLRPAQRREHQLGLCCAVNFRYLRFSLIDPLDRLSGPSSEAPRTEPRRLRRLAPSPKRAIRTCQHRHGYTPLGRQDQQREDDADRHRGGENGAREQASQSRCQRCDGRLDPSSGNQPQYRPSTAGPGHDQVFQPTVDHRAEPAGHRARIRVRFLNDQACNSPPKIRASGDWSEPARLPLPSDSDTLGSHPVCTCASDHYRQRANRRIGSGRLLLRGRSGRVRSRRPPPRPMSRGCGAAL